MHKRLFIVATLILFAMALPAMAGRGDSGSDHSSTDKGFEHHTVVDGIRAEFQVMSLSSMKINDPDGNTHHIMVKFFKEEKDHQIDKAMGMIKIIAPSKKEQTNTLKNYGGIMAANFTFSDQGQYGVICLFKVDGKKHVVKFWYPHHG